MSEPTTPAAPPAVLRTRLGRTAWLVLLAGILGAVLMIGIGLVLERFSNKIEAGMFGSMGVLTCLVFYGWSIVLALRALFVGEKSTSPLMLLNLAALPPAALGIFSWWELPHPSKSDQWFVDWYLPIVLPFVSLAFMSGTFVVKWAIKRIQARRSRAGKAELTHRHRMKLAVTLGLVYALVLAVPTVPVPLYLLIAACQFGLSGDPSGSTAVDLKTAPNFIRDTAETLLHAFAKEEWRSIDSRLLAEGDASESRLVARAHDGDPRIGNNALFGLEIVNPLRAAQCALDVMELPTPRSTRSDLWALPRIIAVHGSSAEKRRYLENARSNPLFQNDDFFRWLSMQKRDDALIPLLQEHLQSRHMPLPFALRPLVEWLLEDEALKLVEAELESKNPASQQFAVHLHTPRKSLQWHLFAMELDHPDAAIRGLVLARGISPNEVNDEGKAELVKRLLALCKSNRDSPEGQGAGKSLYALMNSNKKVLTWEEVEEWLKKNGK